MELTNIKTIEKLFEKYGFSFKKSLGQNFLINPSVCPRMAAASGADKDCGVLEIGPGIGVLTKELSAVAGKVVSVELDSRLIPLLLESLADCDNVKIINSDILKTDVSSLIKQEFGERPVKVCANLPYYITSPVIMGLLEQKLPIDSITVMVQKEAAQRICASPGTRECGAVSLAVSYYCEPKREFSVKRGSFMPAPNVDSEVITLKLRKTPPVNLSDEKMFFKVVRSAFSMRRKTLVNCLSKDFGLSKETLTALLESVSLKPTARAEELSLEKFAEISEMIAKKEY